MISFCVSIDGNKELHDSCRIDLNGKGSYDRAIAAVHHYREHYDHGITSKMTLAPSNIHYTYDAIVNLINEGYDEIFLNCVFEKGWELSHAKIFYNELIKLADYIIDNNLNDKVYISLFEEKYF
jgi:sulfatase maturation enzyme AslB (radical SAM superfamily)